MGEYKPEEGSFNVGAVRIAVIAACWNAEVTAGLFAGAVRALSRHGVSDDALEIYRVPGAFELPLASQRAAQTGRFDGVIALGCVVRGDTPHFDYVCSETTRGIGEVGLTENLPVAFGLLTTDTLEQSLERSGNNAENKGEEAALTVLEMFTIFKQMDGDA